MEIETLKPEHRLTKDNITLNSSLYTFDLPALIENMKHSHTWAKGELNAMVILKTPGRQIVLTAFLLTIANGTLQQTEN